MLATKASSRDNEMSLEFPLGRKDYAKDYAFAITYSDMESSS